MIRRGRNPERGIATTCALNTPRHVPPTVHLHSVASSIVESEGLLVPIRAQACTGRPLSRMTKCRCVLGADLVAEADLLGVGEGKLALLVLDAQLLAAAKVLVVQSPALLRRASESTRRETQ